MSRECDRQARPPNKTPRYLGYHDRSPIPDPLATTRKELADARQEIECLREQNAELVRYRAASALGTDKAADDAAQLRLQVEDRDRRIARNRDAVNATKAAHKHLVEQQRQERAAADTAQRELRRLQAAAEAWENERREQNNANAELGRQIERFRRELDAAGAALLKRGETIAELNERVERYRNAGQGAALADRIRDLEDENGCLTHEIQQLQGENDRLREDSQRLVDFIVAFDPVEVECESEAPPEVGVSAYSILTTTELDAPPSNTSRRMSGRVPPGNAGLFNNIVRLIGQYLKSSHDGVGGS